MGTHDELLGRLELGLKRYKHGVRVDDDTPNLGNTKKFVGRDDKRRTFGCYYIRNSGLY